MFDFLLDPTPQFFFTVAIWCFAVSVITLILSLIFGGKHATEFYDVGFTAFITGVVFWLLEKIFN